MNQRNILAALAALLIVFSSAILASCSDDDDDIITPNFSESTIAGTWKVTEIDSIVSETSSGMGQKTIHIDTRSYDDLYFTIGNGSYILWQTTANNVLESGSYSLALTSFRIDLSSGRKLNWKKREGNEMILESPNANDATRRARYTLEKQWADNKL